VPMWMKRRAAAWQKRKARRSSYVAAPSIRRVPCRLMQSQEAPTARQRRAANHDLSAPDIGSDHRTDFAEGAAILGLHCENG
jgi:hypothetical protein